MQNSLEKDLEKQFGKEYADFLQLMGAIRERLLEDEHDPETHKSKFEALIQKGLIHLIKDRRTDAIDALLRETLGSGYEYKALMNQNDSIPPQTF